MTTQETAYVVNDSFFRRVFYPDEGVEPVIIADSLPNERPTVLFLVRYFIGEGAGGEIRRPIFKDELSGYDYVSELDYPLQDSRLEDLQFLVESHMYGAKEGSLRTFAVRSKTTGEVKHVKAIVSSELVEMLMRAYDFAW